MGEPNAPDHSAATQPTEASLVSRWRDGDAVAFETLYRSYAPKLARRLRRIVGNAADTEDLLQQTFIAAHRNLSRFRSDAPLLPWLFGISFRMVGNYLRTKKRRRRRETGREEQAWPNRMAPGDAESQQVQRNLVQSLYQALAKLPDDKRIAFTLHYIEGMGVTEIGKLVGASPQTVWARVHSAKALLEEQLHSTKPAGGQP